MPEVRDILRANSIYISSVLSIPYDGMELSFFPFCQDVVKVPVGYCARPNSNSLNMCENHDSEDCGALVFPRSRT